MQTRAAAKKLAEMTAVAGCLTGASGEDTKAAVEQVSTITQTPQLMGNSEPLSKIVPGNGKRKRKRAEKKQAQPLKGRWVLPHGMGVGVAEPDTSSPQRAEITSKASPLADPLPTATSLTQAPPVILPPDTEKKTPRQTRRTRLSLQATKIEIEAQTNPQKERAPNVKLEEPDGLYIKEEGDGPRKRLRTVPATDEPASDAPASSKSALELTEVKTEEKNTLNQHIPKVVIIRGIIIKDNVIVKTSSKIIIDATQILDPNRRLIVKRGKTNPYGLTPGYSPYPYRRVPTPEACEEVHRLLTEMHGEVKQPEKMPVASLEVAGCGEVPCVLDALLRTLISGNTLMALADLAIKNLAQHYGLRQEGTGAGSINWDKVRVSSHKELADVIKVAGNGPKRSQHIKQILDMVYEENSELGKTQLSITVAGASQDEAETGKISQNRLSLDHMHGMSKDEAMAKFVSYPGIGIKTAACVTLFCLRMPCFAVDTHVHKFCRWLGWVPEKADPDNCFRHGDFMVPDHLKYGLHQLFIRHGQLCFKCRKATKPGTKDWNEAPDCPLEHLLDRSKDEAGSKPKRAKKMEETSLGTGDSDTDADGKDEEKE